MSEAAVSVILLITGAMTASGGVVGVAPSASFRLIFGAENLDALATLIARHWGLLLACVGGLLIYASSHPELRAPVMVAAMAEKLGIVGLILASRFRARPLAASVAVADGVMIMLYLAILATRTGAA